MVQDGGSDQSEREGAKLAVGKRETTIDVETRPTDLPLERKYDRLTHYLFRFPAKFHPPVVRALLERFTQPDDIVLDPFCGSGTVGVEAAALGRHSVLVDVDPIAVVVAMAKTRRYEPRRLRKTMQAVVTGLEKSRRGPDAYERFKFEDLTDAEYADATLEFGNEIPAIPNLNHWFRRYVVIDLAKIVRAITRAELSPSHRLFADVVLASIIRNVSQADPVPVSGLEVTKWMREREAKGRLVDPFSSFASAMDKAVAASEDFYGATRHTIRTSVHPGDATNIRASTKVVADAVLTSPPYHGAVDYYRRHQLEMFWLGLTNSQAERIELLQHYIGRPHVPPRHPWARAAPPTELVKEWSARMEAVSASRASEFRHYMTGMHRFFGSLATRVKEGGAILLVVGHSTWNKAEIPTKDLFQELAGSLFKLEGVLTYPVRNRYMSYDRHNAANIDREYVLVMKRTKRSTSA